MQLLFYQVDNLVFRMNIEWHLLQSWSRYIGAMHCCHDTSNVKHMFFCNIVHAKGCCTSPWIGCYCALNTS